MNGTFASTKLQSQTFTFDRLCNLLFFGLFFVLLHDALNCLLVRLVKVWSVRVDPLFASHDEFNLVGIENIDLALIGFSFSDQVAGWLFEVFHLNSNL